MGGGLMQLVAYGAQDIYLTGNPQITFFKVVYRRHTNFSMEAIEQSFNETPSYKGGQLTSTLSRSGDLVYRLWLDAEIPDIICKLASQSNVDYRGKITWTNNTGHALIKECEVEIGGQLIDKHYSQWLDIYTELTDKNYSLDSMLNKKVSRNLFNIASTSAPVTLCWASRSRSCNPLLAYSLASSNH